MAIGIIATFEALPEHTEAVKAALLKVIESSRKDEGNQHYHLNVDPESSTTFVMIEQWASKELLAAHEETAHFKELVASLEGKLAQPLDVTTLSVID